MQERIERFVAELKEKQHILKLAGNLDVIVGLEFELGVLFLSFKDGATKISTGVEVRHYLIAGEAESFHQLLDGEIKLREGIRLNFFTTDCPFRLQLALESIFYLARPRTVMNFTE